MTKYFMVQSCRLTQRITNPAPVRSNLKRRRDRGVRCSPWFGDQSVLSLHILRPTPSRPDSGGQPGHCEDKQTTDATDCTDKRNIRVIREIRAQKDSHRCLDTLPAAKRAQARTF